MEELLEGFRHFRATDFLDHKERFRHLARVGQSPKAVVVSCCDSRVDPQMIFTAAPGDLFIIRNVANLVPPYHPNADYHGTSAALEFGVRRLAVNHVVVLGHTQCGGIRALLEEDVAGDSDFIGHWMAIAEPVRRHVCCDHGHAHEHGHEHGHGHGHGRDATDRMLREAEEEGIRTSLANLMSFPWISQRVADGSLALHGCLFDVSAADLLVLDTATGRFHSTTSPTPAP